jgi:hypothetical protein
MLFTLFGHDLTISAQGKKMAEFQSQRLEVGSFGAEKHRMRTNKYIMMTAGTCRHTGGIQMYIYINIYIYVCVCV